MGSKITKRRIILAISLAFLLMIAGNGWFALDRARQSHQLKRLEIDISPYEPHSLHEPIRDLLYDLQGGSPDRAEEWLWLFAEAYGIQDKGHDCTAEEKRKIVGTLRGWPINRAGNIDFRGLHLEDSDFQRFGDLPLLETLWLGGPHLTDKIVPMIARQAPNLKELWFFEGPAIEGSHFDQLRHIKAASTPGGDFCLNLSNIPVRDSAIQQIADHCPGITSLFLSDPALTDAGLEKIGTLSQLKSLTIGGSGFAEGAGDDFQKLAALPNLEELHLFEGPDTGIRSLLDSTMPGLKDLTISSFPLSAGDVEKITGFAPNLTSLTLTQCDIGNNAIEKLLSLKKLKKLTLTYNPNLTDEAEPVLKRFGAITIWVYGSGMSSPAIERIEKRP